ncbi:hypothetical protein D3C73_1512870 [compost metagenome]
MAAVLGFVAAALQLHRDRPLASDQLADGRRWHRRVGLLVDPLEVQPDDLAVAQTNHRRAGVTAQAGAIVGQQLIVGGRLQNQPRCETFDVV